MLEHLGRERSVGEHEPGAARLAVVSVDRCVSATPSTRGGTAVADSGTTVGPALVDVATGRCRPRDVAVVTGGRRRVGRPPSPSRVSATTMRHERRQRRRARPATTARRATPPGSPSPRRGGELRAGERQLLPHRRRATSQAVPAAGPSGGGSPALPAATAAPAMPTRVAATSSAELGRSSGLLADEPGDQVDERPARRPGVRSVTARQQLGHVDLLGRRPGHRRRPPAGVAGEHLQHHPPERVQVGPPVELGQARPPVPGAT